MVFMPKAHHIVPIIAPTETPTHPPPPSKNTPNRHNSSIALIIKYRITKLHELST